MVLLEEIGPTVRGRGHYAGADLIAVGPWKVARATGYLGLGSDSSPRCSTACWSR